MGQTVQIKDSVAVGNVLVIDTDRSFTGQDGESAVPGSPGGGVPGILAAELFGLGIGIDHVFVQQNTVTVRRSDGWDDASASKVAGATASFLRFYDEEE